MYFGHKEIISLNTSSTKYLKLLKSKEKRFVYREKKNKNVRPKRFGFYVQSGRKRKLLNN
jgi:hypothetical protein